MKEELFKILNLIVPATREEIQERINDLDEGDESYEEYKSMLTRDEACDKIFELFKQSSTDEKMMEFRAEITAAQGANDLDLKTILWVQQKLISIFGDIK